LDWHGDNPRVKLCAMNKLTETFRAGWNVFALLLIAVSALVAGASWFGISWKFGDTIFSQMAAFGVAGVTMIVCDVLYRARQTQCGKVWRFLSPVSGGSFLLVPSWCVGIATIAVAVVIYRSEIPR
jgi:hypothetical protein